MWMSIEPVIAWLSTTPCHQRQLVSSIRPNHVSVDQPTYLIVRMNLDEDCKSDSHDDDDDDHPNKERDENEIPFFDDFGDTSSVSSVSFGPSFIGREDMEASIMNEPASSSSSLSSLSFSLRQRIQQVRQHEQQVQSQIQQNWEQGNWVVRGLTLDIFSDVTSMEGDEVTTERVLEEEEEESEESEDVLQQQQEQQSLPSWRENGNVDDRDPQNFLPKDFLVPKPDSIVGQPHRKQPSPIYVRTCAVHDSGNETDDDDEIILWLGRTDGSLVGIQYGEAEPWARFSTQLIPCVMNNQFIVKPGLVKEKTVIQVNKEHQDDAFRDDYETVRTPHDDAIVKYDEGDEFALVAQILEARQPSPVEHILPIPQHHLVLSATSSNGDIQAWLLPRRQEQQQTMTSSTNDGISPSTFLVPAQTWTGVHSKPLVDLSWVPQLGMVSSVSRDGTLALWDTSTACGLTTAMHLSGNARKNGSQESIIDNEPMKLLAAHVTDDYLIVGTVKGEILVYDWKAILSKTSTEVMAGQVRKLGLGSSENQDQVQPVGSFWTSYNDAPVTAIASSRVKHNGKDILYVVTGDGRGMVKQWQLFPTHGGDRVESWPKMSSQRLSDRAHIFTHSIVELESFDENRNRQDSIVDLQYLQNGELLLTASAETIKCWNTKTGRQWHSLEGFEGLRNICLLPQPRYSSFCTNGMKNVVCIHDYGGAVGDDEEDDNFDVMDYLNFDK